jgi:hypothetical protein
VPTRIYFTGSEKPFTVDQGPEEVAEGLSADAAGGDFMTPLKQEGKMVYINRAAIAYLVDHAATSGRGVQAI